MQTEIELGEKIRVCGHPVALHNLAKLRDKKTTPDNFRLAAKKIAQILLLNATDNLPMISTKIETPLMETKSHIIDPSAEIIIAPILRAGLAFSEAASEILPFARIHHLGLYRDEKTLMPVSYYNNLPGKFSNPEKTYVYILDPMLATGGSAAAAVKLFIDLNISQDNIRFISLISAPEGIKKLHDIYPDISIITCCVDSYLNEFGYIMPGLGDAGDRSFNTTY